MTSTATRQLAPLDIDRCLHLLGRSHLGRLAYVAAGLPAVVPLNYLLHEGSVVLRISYGPLRDAVVGAPVAFEVDEVDEDYHTGWSVVVHGRAEEVWRREELERMRSLPLRPWAPGAREHYVRIGSRTITGRTIT